VSSALNVSGGIRYEHDGYKIGPIVQGGLSKVWNARQQRKETGPLRMQYTSSAEGSQVNVSATLAAGFKPVGHFSDDFGHVKAISLPSAGAIGVGTTVLQSETGVQWRLTEEDGEFDPALCYRDATFTSVENFKRYVDSRRAAWDKTYAAQPPGAAVPEPMDEYLARVDQDATSGNQLYAERTWMKPAAGAVLNALRAMRDIRAQAVASTGGKRVPDGRFDEDAAISKLLLDEASWDNRFLYSLEFTGESRVQGPSFLGVLQRVTEVSHPHQLSVLRAERPNENAGN